MDEPAASRLTERHKQCLRLVLIHYDSKRIGRHLGIAHHTVNKRVEEAIRILGVQTRFEAARVLAQYEHGSGYERFVSEQVALDGVDAIDADELPSKASLKGETRNQLSASERLRLIALYALGFLIAIALLAGIADTLLRFLLRVLHGN